MTNVFTVEQYPAAKEKAKELGINFVGKSKQTLVDLVNAALENTSNTQETPAGPAKKWYEEVDLGVNEGDTVQIVSKTIEKAGVKKEILQGRYAQILKASPRKGLVRATLLDPQTGELLNCPITLELGKFNKVSEDWVFTPAKQEQPASETTEVA
ncbi:hypothetical protein D3C81_333650 [compost metagenome]